MFDKKFSIESAYYVGGRNVMNYFSFFLFAMGIGMVVCTAFLMFLGVIDFFELRNHLSGVAKLFHHVFNSAQGSLHHAGFTIRDFVSSYLPSDVIGQAMGHETVSFDISRQDIMDLLYSIIPTALALKLFVDMISVGWTKVALDMQAGKKVTVYYLFEYYYLVPRVFIVNLIVNLATILGTMFLLVPGIFVYQRFRFAKYFIIDKNLSVVKALQSSWALTDGAVVQLFGFSMITFLVDSIARMFFFVELFVTPLKNQVETNVYTQLRSSR